MGKGYCRFPLGRRKASSLDGIAPLPSGCGPLHRLGLFLGLAPADGTQSGPDVRLCIAVPQAVQAEKPLGSRWADGGVLHVGPILHRISLPPKGGQEGIKNKALLDGGVYVLADQAGDGGPAPVLRVPLSVVFSLSLGLNDGQAIVPAHGVGGSPHLAEVALKVAPILLSVHKGDGVEYDVTVIVLPVQVGGHHGLIAVPQQGRRGPAPASPRRGRRSG